MKGGKGRARVCGRVRVRRRVRARGEGKRVKVVQDR